MNYVDVIQKGAPIGSAGYQIEVQLPGQLPVLLPRQAYFSLQPFQNPEGVPQGKHRILFCQASGERANLDPGVDIFVELDFGVKPDQPTQPAEVVKPAAEAMSKAADGSAREPLAEGLHPAAESEESMEREIFSQHIERNEYSNFKLRSETRAIECLYSVIQRMAADQHAMFQNTLETPRRMTHEFKQMIETMGEAMKSFHSMVELQSIAMQAIQKQVEMARVPTPPPPPPDYVGLGKSLLEIIRDLGMKAMDSGYGKRSLPPRNDQALPEILDAEVCDPIRPARAKGPLASEQSTTAEAPLPTGAASALEENNRAESADGLRRILMRMGDVNIARAFSGPEGFKEFLTDIRREIDEERTQAATKRTPAPAGPTAPAQTSAVAPVAASQRTAPPVLNAPRATSTSTPIPPSSQTDLTTSTMTPPPASARTPSSRKSSPPRPENRSPHGAKPR